MADENNPDMIGGAYNVPEPLRTELFHHLDANAGDGELNLGEDFENPDYLKLTGERDLLKQQLADLVVHHIVSIQDFEFLTLYYFKTEQEYHDYLKNEFWPDVFPGENPEDFCTKHKD